MGRSEKLPVGVSLPEEKGGLEKTGTELWRNVFWVFVLFCF